MYALLIVLLEKGTILPLHDNLWPFELSGSTTFLRPHFLNQLLIKSTTSELADIIAGELLS